MALNLEMEHEFPFGIFCPEKQEYLFRSSIAPRNFLLEWPQKSASTCFPTGNGKQPCKWYKKKHFVNGKQPWSPRHTVKALFEGLIFGGAYIRRGLCTEGNLCFKPVGLACSGKEIYHICFVFLGIRGQIPSTSPPGGLYLEGRFNQGFLILCYNFGRLIFGGAYFRNFMVYLVS